MIVDFSRLSMSMDLNVVTKLTRDAFLSLEIPVASDPLFPACELHF